MSKLKHTPGPWSYEITDETVNKLDILITSGDQYISWVYGEKEANARLIAAAPEMLEWLIEYYRGNIKAFGCYNETVLKNLIEKATGMSIEEVLKDE